MLPPDGPSFSDDMWKVFPFEIPTTGAVRLQAIAEAKRIIAWCPVYKGGLVDEIEALGIFTSQEIDDILSTLPL